MQKSKYLKNETFFPQSKNSLVTRQGLLYAKKTFVAEVTFNKLQPYYQKHVNQIILNRTIH